MNLQNFAALLWLIPLAGIIILLYLLRMRRRDVRVPATFLWPARVDEVRANALFQKLRFSWLLLLQLLALALVVFALARPQTKQQGLAGEVTVLVIDASASMGATDVAPSRFEEAKRLAKESIQAARTGDRIALIEAGPTPRVVSALSGDPAKQLRALETMYRSDAECDIGEALRLAAALVGSKESARIVLLSDGVFEPVRNFSRGKAAIVYKSIGKSNDNVGITALGTADTTQGRKLYCGVKNFSLKDKEAVLNLFADGKIIDSQKFKVAGGKSFGATLDAPAGAKVFEARLENKDALAADNYAVSLADPGSSLYVLLVSNGNIFLERALSLDPRVTLDRAAVVPENERAGSAGAGKYDIVVFDGMKPIAVKARGVLTFGESGPGVPVQDLGESKVPTFVSADEKPLMKGVDLQGVYIDRARRIKATGTGEVLATGSAGPLVVAAQGDQKHVYVAFESLQSDFPLSVAFPIFVSNALDFLGGQGRTGAIAIKAGMPFSVPLGAAAKLTSEDGSTSEIEPTGKNVVVREAKRIGRYTLEGGGVKKTVYASLQSERESDIDPKTDIRLGGGEVRTVQAPVHFSDFWRPLALLALLVLSAEWWLYARRS